MTEEKNKEYNRKYIELQNKGYTHDQIIKEIGNGGLWEGWKAFEKPKYTGRGGYHGGGRPRKDAEARRVTISISGTPTEINELKKRAADAGLNVSRFVLDNLTK